MACRRTLHKRLWSAAIMVAGLALCAPAGADTPATTTVHILTIGAGEIRIAGTTCASTAAVSSTSCTVKVPFGADVSAEAVAAGGYKLTTWLGSCYSYAPGANNASTICVVAAKDYTLGISAKFETGAAAPAKPLGRAPVLRGTMLTNTSLPIGIGGGVPTAPGILTIVVHGHGKVRANGLDCTGTGTAPQTCTAAYLAGKPLSVETTEVPGATLSGVSRSCPASGCAGAVHGNVRVEAYFIDRAPVHLKVVIASKGGKVTATGAPTLACTYGSNGFYGGYCYVSVPYGTPLVLHAVAEKGFDAAHFTSDSVGCNAAYTCAFSATSDREVTTGFFPYNAAVHTITFTYTHTSADEVAISVLPKVKASWQCGGDKPTQSIPTVTGQCRLSTEATQVAITLTRVKIPGGALIRAITGPGVWGGDCKGSDLTCTLTMDSSKTVQIIDGK